MGFYDEDPYTSEVTKSKKNRDRSNSPLRRWASSFFSAVLGGLIVALSIPGLSSLNLLPYDVVPKSDTGNQPVVSEADTQQLVQQTVQLSVNSDIVDAVEKVSNAVVGVINIQEQTDFFSRQIEEEVGTGSGVVFGIEGDRAYIVTNYHVIESAQRVEISLPSGERMEATLKGADQLTDLAVLEIDAEHVSTVAEFGDSDSLRPGEPVIAIGNPLGLEFSRTVTQGIVSATERSVQVDDWEINVIQTDAAINPGNSGGALVNVQGQVVGINSLKIARSDIEGLGFAIPINEAIPIINSLVEHGEVLRPQMGVGVLNLTDVDSYHWQNTLNLPEDITQGVIVRSVTPMSPAEEAGLAELDVIVEIDGEPVRNTIDLRKQLYKKNIGDKVEVKVYRGKLPQTFEVELGSSAQ